jgi:hypothetical protein
MPSVVVTNVQKALAEGLKFWSATGIPNVVVANERAIKLRESDPRRSREAIDLEAGNTQCVASIVGKAYLECRSTIPNRIS